MDDKVPEIDIKITTHKVTGKVRKLRPGFRGSKKHILEQLVDGVVQQWLHRDLFASRQISMPNFTPDGWWECDMWSVTKSLFSHEYEIKLTVPDFKADVKKTMRRFNPHFDVVSKHQLLSERSESGPNYFWYVTPPGLLDGHLIPEWAGHMEIRQYPSNQFFGLITKCVPAPRLHKTKVSEKVMEKALKACYYRYWDERLRLDKTQADYEILIERTAGDRAQAD